MAAVAPNAYIKAEFVKHFPAQDYPLLKKNGKHAVFHFLIALSQPDAQILAWLKTCTERQEQQKFISFADNVKQIYFGQQGKVVVESTGLAPLSMAVLFGRKVLVQALCDSPHVNLDALDRAGWTAQQHAIARNDLEILEIVEKAIDAQAKTAGKVVALAKNRFPFLRKMVQDLALAADVEVVRYRDESGVMRSLTQSQFMEMTGGAQFYDGLIGSPDSIYRNWYRNEIRDKAMIAWMRKRFADYCRNKPKLFLTLEGDAGLGVSTERKIKRSTLAAFCGSELIRPEEAGVLTDPYSNGVATGNRLRNYGVIVNDGFPNVQELPIVADGVEFSGLVALRDIMPHERILHSYHYSHRIKWEPREELAVPEILKSFPYPASPAKVWKGLQKMDPNATDPDLKFDYHCKKAGLVYLLHTPSILLGLCLRGHFNLDSLERLLQDPKLLNAADLDKGAGPILLKFYRNAFAELRHYFAHGPVEAKEYMAAAIEKNVRAGSIAFQWILKNNPADWRAAFDRIYQGAEAFFVCVESRGDFDEAKGVFMDLIPLERAEIIMSTRCGDMFIFETVKETVESVYKQFEEKSEYSM